MCSLSQQEIDFEKMFHEKREIANKLKRKVMQLEEENAKLKIELEKAKYTLELFRAEY